MTDVRIPRPRRSKKRETRSAASAGSSLAISDRGGVGARARERVAVLRVASYRGQAHVIKVDLNGQAELKSIGSIADVAEIAARALCLDPNVVHLHVESGVVARLDALVGALSRARATVYVHLMGLAHAPHADNAIARAALIARGFKEETTARFSRHADLNPAATCTFTS